jgi:hypothetical protein
MALASVARETCQSSIRLDALQAGAGQRALRVEHVEDVADAGLVAAERDALGMLGAGQQVGAGAHRLGGGRQALVGLPDVERHLQADVVARAAWTSVRASAARTL